MNKRFMKALPGLLAAAVVAPLLTSGTAHAIPAFARQAKTACATCHTIMPELTEAGANFKKNGFVWEQKGAAKEAGAEKEYLLLSTIPEFVPLSLSVDLGAAYDDKLEGGKKFDFAARSVKLQAGGNFGEKVGFWASYKLYTEASEKFDNTMYANVAPNSLPDLIEAYAVGRKLFDTPVNFKVGRFQPGVSLWEKEDRTTLSEYATTATSAGDSLFKLDAPGDGAELNAVVLPRLFVAAGGIKRKNVSEGDFYLSAAYKLMGEDFNSRAAENPNHFSATVGAFGYSGTNLVGAAKEKNHFYRAGVEGDLAYMHTRAKLAYFMGEDKVAAAGAKVEPTVVSAELSCLCGKQFMPAVRFERVEQKQVSVREYNYIGAITYAPLQSLKIVGEVKYTDAGSTNTTYNLGLTGAF